VLQNILDVAVKMFSTDETRSTGTVHTSARAHLTSFSLITGFSSVSYVFSAVWELSCAPPSVFKCDASVSFS